VLKRVQGLLGTFCAATGSISQPLAEPLLVVQGVQRITRRRTNIRQRLVPLPDKLVLRKRAIIETIDDQLKTSCQIEHTRHRSPLNVFVNLVCGLIASCHQPKQPSLHMDATLDRLALPPA
jgi:hypothetical protein